MSAKLKDKDCIEMNTNKIYGFSTVSISIEIMPNVVYGVQRNLSLQDHVYENVKINTL